ncbi:MAG: hypothetical protein ABJF04_11275 [Reichenbachiella sp.]|uniref:hypothetical protein n=1 Tax=Reichenbachiella sp. TaxID=2184521 RepID=UPI0032677D3B
MRPFQNFGLASFLFFLSCDCDQKTETASLPLLYREAIEDAIKMEPREFYDSLRTLKGDSVVMVTWISSEHLQDYKDKWSSGKPKVVKGFDMWVTSVPDLKNFCIEKGFNDTDSASTRLKQLLGLSPSNNNQYFIEVKAKWDHVYRATPNPDARTVGTFLPDDSVTVTKPYKEKYTNWYNKTLAGSYEGEEKMPWTRLGYTYDWGNQYSDIGLSEFVIPGKMESASFDVKVVGIYSTEQYCVLTKKDPK